MRFICTCLIILAFVVCKGQTNGMQYYELGQLKYKDGKLKQAYKYYLKAAEIEKNYLYYIKAAEAYWLSHAVSKEKNKRKVEELYNMSFKLKSWNSEGLLSRANYWNYVANYKMALINLDSLLVRDTANIEGYLLKAQIFMLKKDTVKAFNVYNFGLKNVASTDKSSIYLDRGFYSYLKGYWQSSIDSYLKAIEILGKDKFKYYCFLSSSYYNIGDSEKACIYFKLCNINKWPTLNSKDALINICK